VRNRALQESAGAALKASITTARARWKAVAWTKQCLGLSKVAAMVLVFLSLAESQAAPTPFDPTAYLNLRNSNSAAHQASQQPDLNLLIDALQKKYSRMTAIGADFAQIYMGQDGRTLREGGHVVLKRPRKARWDYTHPEHKVFISDGKNIFFYVYGDPEATRTPIKESADPQVPFLFLLGQGNLRRDFSRIEIDNNQQPVIAGDVVLKLVPKRAPEDFKQLLAEVTPSSAEVRRLVILQRNGAAMDFYLSNVISNIAVPDSEFAFTPPPGVTVRRANQ
jgi:chaperone LolA